MAKNNNSSLLHLQDAFIPSDIRVLLLVSLLFILKEKNWIKDSQVRIWERNKFVIYINVAEIAQSAQQIATVWAVQG